MGKFFGILSFDNGFVIVSDIKADIDDQSYVMKINTHNAVVLADDLEYGKKFCEQYIMSTISENDGLQEIVMKATSGFQTLSKEYAGKILTMHFLGYDSKIQENSMHVIMFDGKQIIANVKRPSHEKTLFTFEVNLGHFIVNKVYSNYMSVQEAINLMGYVFTQYRTLYQDNIGKSFTMYVISESEVRSLSDKEVKSILENSEKIDIQLRKDYSDLFLQNNAGI